MDQRVSIITLGVADLARAVGFYRDGLGWRMSSASDEEVAFFQAGGIVLALFPRPALAEDACIAPEGSGFCGVSLSQNVFEPEQVEQALDEAAAAGGAILKPAQPTAWGGVHGYFADPDGYPWEVAWNPSFDFAPDGSLILPD